jgi:hypothetical protein
MGIAIGAPLWVNIKPEGPCVSLSATSADKSMAVGIWLYVYSVHNYRMLSRNACPGKTTANRRIAPRTVICIRDDGNPG